jgi:phage replication-related protein YjqB (UPF0714/DUF867 family)
LIEIFAFRDVFAATPQCAPSGHRPSARGRHVQAGRNAYPGAVFGELLQMPGVVEDVQLRSRIGFMAIHGGSLERRTAELATLAAERAGASLYAVRQPEDLRWHLPSHLVDPGASPALSEFVGHVDVVYSLHGYGRAGFWTTLLLGGANRAVAAATADALRAALPGYLVVDDVDAIPADLRGLHPTNPVNLPRRGGVQLELPPRVRGLGPHWRTAPDDELVPPACALVDALAALATRG